MSTRSSAGKYQADAFRRLYDANRERISRFLAQTAGAEEADDLAQVVFAKAAKGLHNFRGDAQASTWLYRIAANVASDWLRGRSAIEAKVTVQLPNALEHGAYAPGPDAASRNTQTSPEQELVRKEMRDCIRGVIGQLSDKHRTVLVLGELGGFTDDQVAKTLKISRGNAKVRLHRARAQLKNALETQCDFSHNEDNEFVCEPKPATGGGSSKCPGHPSTVKPCAQPGSKAL